MGKFEIIDIKDTIRWDHIVKSFRQNDIYYFNKYVRAFQIHGDGEPILIYYQAEDLRGFNVTMKRDISLFDPLKKSFPVATYFDIITPYGYGGFIFEGNVNDENLVCFNNDYLEILNNEHIICEFVRYHPLLDNAKNMCSVSTVLKLGKTISIDLESIDLIWTNITSKNRNMIRKAQKSGIIIQHGKSNELMNEFIRIYNSTMEKDNASNYYYFHKMFYKSIQSDLDGNYELFYAVYDNKIISMSIMLFTNERMHYHLSGSDFEYRNLAPTNLLLYEAACWGCNQGYRTLHLGGGIGSNEDNLFKFKQAFNRNSYNSFFIGKQIYNQKVYDDLVEIREINNLGFNKESSFFPLYRA